MPPLQEGQLFYIERQLRVPTFSMSYEHYHTYCEIFYLKAGACTYSVNGSYFHLSAGDVIIVAAGDRHATRYEGLETCERIIVFCKPESLPQEFCARLPETRVLISRSVKILLDPRARAALESLQRRMFAESEEHGPYADEFLRLYLQELLLLLKSRGILSYETSLPVSDADRDMEQALRYIALNYSLPLTLEAVAGQASLSPTYFSRKFKQVTGVTFKEHVNRIRLKQASQRLLTTDDSITKIAIDCGFNSSNYFKDLFRKTMGLSPREFRKESNASVKKYARRTQ